MKKTGLVLSTILLVLFVSCASNKVANNEPIISKKVTREMIDWKGASLNAEIPAWVYDAIEEDYQSLSKLPQLKNKKIIFAEGTGKDLDLLKSWVNNFDVQGTFSKSITNFVSAKFGAELSGSKDNSVSQNYLDELVSTISRTEINGLSKELDFWVLSRTNDSVKGTVTDQYEYFVVYAIDCSTLEYQIADALGAVEASTEAENEMKTKISKEMTETQIFYEGYRK